RAGPGSGAAARPAPRRVSPHSRPHRRTLRARRGSGRTDWPAPARRSRYRSAGSRSPRSCRATGTARRRIRPMPAARSPGGGALPLPPGGKAIDEGGEGIGVAEAAGVELPPGAQEEGGGPVHAARVPFIVARLDPAGVAVAVHARLDEGDARGVNGTPTYFL